MVNAHRALLSYSVWMHAGGCLARKKRKSHDYNSFLSAWQSPNSVRRGVYHLFCSTTFMHFTAISQSFNCMHLLNFEQMRALTCAIQDKNINEITYLNSFWRSLQWKSFSIMEGCNLNAYLFKFISQKKKREKESKAVKLLVSLPWLFTSCRFTSAHSKHDQQHTLIIGQIVDAELTSQSMCLTQDALYLFKLNQWKTFLQRKWR